MGKKTMFWAFLCLFQIGLKNPLFAQQSFTVASVSFFIDTIDNAEKAKTVMHLIQKHSEVRDFDLKQRSCNFTLDNQKRKLDNILSDLKIAGFLISNLYVRELQTFTTVPKRENPPKKEITEEEALRLREKGMLPKE